MIIPSNYTERLFRGADCRKYFRQLEENWMVIKTPIQARERKRVKDLQVDLPEQAQKVLLSAGLVGV